MQRLWIAAGLLTATVVVGMICLTRVDRSEWTTNSAAALKEFKKGLAAEMKYYESEARAHYQQAVELDPDFAVAKLSLLGRENDKLRRAELYSELSQAPLDNVSDRERFMIQYELAGIDHRPDEAERVITEYLAEHPTDPFALGYRCAEAWDAKDFDAAEKLYKQLLKADPNWVMAQNHLGYIAMAQGRFAEAEELFNTYKYVAPDQANPHDSLGELLTLLGRYEEAQIQLQEALRIKPDFCASYDHLVEAAVLAGDFESAETSLDAGQQHCGSVISWFTRCRFMLWRAFLTGDYESAWSDENSACLNRLAQAGFLVHRLAILTGRMDRALEIESMIQERTEKIRDYVGTESKARLGLLSHLKGTRLIAQSDPESALESLRSADEQLLYWGQGQGLAKLFNRLHISIALDALGRQDEAQALLTEVRRVNPRMEERYDEIRASLTSLEH